MSGRSQDILRALGVLFEPGDVVELRVFGEDAQIKSGYFDDLTALAEEADALDRGGWQCFMTANPVNRALLTRAPNATVDRPGGTTTDRDILLRRWLILDIDPLRPANTSATHEEKTAAYLTARKLRNHLRDQGWPDPIAVDSGNGFWLLYRVCLPNDRESKELVKRVLEALAAEFDDEAKIDTAVHNAARLLRLIGSVNRKGQPTEQRPHRRSKIKKIPKEA